MSIVRPFRCVKYNTEQVLLKNVITPPYDVISAEMRERFVAKSPYNVALIDLPAGGDDKYQTAGNLYRQWKEDKILVKDGQQSFYLYEQVYEYGGKQYVRSGFVGLLKLSEFGKGSVFPHEKTLSGPKVDRYELMKASKANFSQIFGLYQDDENRLYAIFNDVKKTMPASSAVDEDGVKHSVWAIDDEEDISQIESFMRDKSIYIADGHHRYETALEYRNYMRSKEGVTEGEERSYDYVMMMFVNFMDDGLKVFPTHRVIDVADDFDDKAFCDYASAYFEMETLDGREAAINFLKEYSKEPGSWVFQGKSSLYGMRILAEAKEKQRPVYRKVSAYLLEDLILKGYFKYSDERLLAKAGIHFIQTWDEIEEYKNKNSAVAFILNGESMESIREVSESGLVMPQKSTYFYLKLATGLLFNDL
ncbi:MAG: DUF1015 domain-containing protein [Mucispirillum sp.]|nr:DUF1015 domain-containing protein [Mucispirillum sp.]